MVQVIKKAVYKHGYIIITAAWLYTISFLFTNYFSYSSSTPKVAAALEKYIAEQEDRFENLVNDTVAMHSLVNNQPAGIKLKLQKEVLGLFAYRFNYGLATQQYWNNNIMSVSPADVIRPDGHYFVTYPYGSFDYIKRTVQIGNNRYFIACLIPIHWTFFLERDSLKPGFQNFPELESKYVITADPGATIIRNSQGMDLFRIKSRQNVNNDQPGTFSTLLRVLAVILLIVFINSIATDIVPARGFYKAFLFLIIVVVVLRLITYSYPVPFDFRQLKLFNKLEGNNELGPFNKSIGDLLINSVLLFWITSFIKFNRPALFSKGMVPNKQSLLTITIGSVFMLMFITFALQDVISGLVTHASVKFEVTNFFTIDYPIIISFVIICLLVLSFFYISHLLIKPLLRLKETAFRKLIIVLVVGLAFVTLRSIKETAIINFIVLLWFVVYITLLSYRRRDSRTSIIESPFFLFWAIFFMVSVTALITYRVNRIELDNRKTIAADYVIQTDRQTLDLLRMSISNIDDEAFSNNFWRFGSAYDNRFIKDSLINNNFAGYLTNYETHIYTFNADHNALFNEDSISYPIVKTIIQTKARPTGMPFIYAYENTLGGYSYIYEKQVYNSDSTYAGAMFIMANPKYNSKDAFFLTLFNDVRDLSEDVNTNYSIAVYYKKKLVKTSNNDFEFVDTLVRGQVPRFQDTLINASGYSQLWYNAGSNKVVVVVKKSDWLLSSFTIFSYLFCLFIAVVILLHYSNLLFKTRFRYVDMQKVFSFNIRTQVQATIIAISIFSFLVIGVITISFFVVSFNKDSEAKLTNSAIIVRNEIEESIKQSPAMDIRRRVNDIARLHNADITYFDKSGNMLASSLPYIYTRHILSNKMNYSAFFALHFNNTIKYIQKERIGSTSFLSAYVVVRDENDNVMAYLNVPSLNSQNELKLEINNFLVTLININALIFIFAGGIAILVTSRITSSFTLIGNKMREISLGRTNEEIAWHGRDEIGSLVDEYNKMVHKLEDSARALARSEREGAWREMARQVAHEIKNPLTPMKLSIQYLQRAINNNAPNVKELSQQVANTLIEQIEQLSKIAGDFSQFANIGNVKIENFNISEVLASLINLYSADSNLHIIWNKEDIEFVINADKTQINRLFTNLIKNAIEASAEDKLVEVKIDQYREKNNVVIAITDKGSGIPPDMQEKIFVPNFTTKSSGTGLGLAICHGIVEKANGHIWFETQVNKGTTFYVSLPLVG